MPSLKKPRKSAADIEQQIEELKAKRDAALNLQAKRIGELALKAGLTTKVGITDEELAAEFKAIAARFQGQKAKPNGHAGTHDAGDRPPQPVAHEDALGHE